MTEFEEITIDSDEEKNEQLFDGFEEVEIPDDEHDYSGTKWCRCHCHRKTDDTKWSERKRHCMSCGIKVNLSLYEIYIVMKLATSTHTVKLLTKDILVKGKKL